MAYVKGNTIPASDIAGFLTTVSNIYGMGTGNRGYGQSAVTLTAPTTGQTITSATWTSLRTALTTCATHQGTAVTQLVPGTALAVGQVIYAHETNSPSSNTYDLDSYVTAIDTNRLTAAVGQMTLTSSALSVARTGTWQASISCTIEAAFASEDAARYYFNSGGQLRIRLSHAPSSPTAQDTEWGAILGTKLGTVTVTASSITNSGTVNMCGSAPAGFYAIPTTATAIATGTNVGSGSYASNDLSVTAQVLNRANIRGGNGNTIRFVITLVDQHTTLPDVVKAGTTVAIDHYRATTTLTGISAPTLTNTTSGGNWTGS